MVNEFMKVAYAPTKCSYYYNLANLEKEGGVPIKKFLEKLPLDKWWNAFF